MKIMISIALIIVSYSSGFAFAAPPTNIPPMVLKCISQYDACVKYCETVPPDETKPCMNECRNEFSTLFF
jgi:hypothetical protein